MSTFTITIRADSQQDMTALLAEHGILTFEGGALTKEIGLLHYYAGAAPAVASGWFFMGHWDDTVQGKARRAELQEALGAHYWTGADVANVLGVAGYSQPTGDELIRHKRQQLQLSGGFPMQYQGQQVWWHSNYQSRDQQTGLMIAGIVGILKSILTPAQWAAVTAAPMVNPRTGLQQTWRLMSGGEVSLTIGLMFDLLMAAMGQEGSIDAVAQAAIAKGTPADKVPWPATYGA